MSFLNILKQNPDEFDEIFHCKRPIRHQTQNIKQKSKILETTLDSDSIETNYSQIHENSCEKTTKSYLDSPFIKSKDFEESKIKLNDKFTSNKFKTEKCKNYELFGDCKFGQNCFFAHGKVELRSKITFSHFYKTKLCRNYFKGGFCHYSSRCQYFHLKPSCVYFEICESYLNKVYAKIALNENGALLNLNENKAEILKGRLPFFLKLSNENKKQDCEGELEKRIEEEVMKL